jgi:hypothetical protein
LGNLDQTIAVSYQQKAAWKLCMLPEAVLVEENVRVAFGCRGVVMNGLL